MGKKFIGWVLDDNKDILPDRAVKDGSHFERAKKTITNVLMRGRSFNRN